MINQTRAAATMPPNSGYMAQSAHPLGKAPRLKPIVRPTSDQA